MKVIDGYDGTFEEMTETTHPSLIGKVFSSYQKVIDLLKVGETVHTWQDGKGYKQVGIDKGGRAWTQRNFVHEI